MIIEIKNLNFAYAHENVLENVSFTVDKGDFITILGPNGGGKTTLLRIILGLLKPQSGSVSVLGKKPHTLRREMGYVPQRLDFDAKYPITAYEVVLTGTLCRAAGFYTRRDKAAATAALERINITDLKGLSFAELSGGQKQRVLIARALASQPAILLLDEPTANLDPSAGQTLNTLLKNLNLDLTILLVSHDLGFVTEITKRVLCVNREVIEHPLENVDDQILHAAYNSRLKLVRHDVDLHPGQEEARHE